ncbi:uncharacterized protein LOC118735304 [Rhagoletis pomonella]|uniref:uncharacterized protein LOC118735304 n=1 Tax=Rhagoletis pomonella TaxID=28610 RepID=UPI00177D3813|nr:uncharacterized protein LOC118735304 [Rhagoletis pomonella]
MIKMQEDLHCLYKWLCVNRLQLNVNKTKFMVIYRAANVSSDNYSLKIKDEVIEKVRIIKYLGIYIDDKLKFEEHIDYTVAKIGKKIGLMKRSSSDTQIDKLQKMQNRAMRFILNKRYDTPIQEMIASPFHPYWLDDSGFSPFRSPIMYEIRRSAWKLVLSVRSNGATLDFVHSDRLPVEKFIRSGLETIPFQPLSCGGSGNYTLRPHIVRDIFTVLLGIPSIPTASRICYLS